MRKIVSCTVECYKQIIKIFLPVPKKSHYIFNLRDLSKVFQGLSLANSKTLPDVTSFIRLWIHEMRRVFSDRLLEEKDHTEFETLINSTVTEDLNMDAKVIFAKQRILFGDFIEKEQDMKTYKEIEDLTKLSSVLEEILEDYNNENIPMNLILFSDCCEHISRLCRIVGFPRGNALLMGVGGSGRQSCTKLANFVMQYKLYTIEITKD